MTDLTKSLSINGVVRHYKELNQYGNIKLIFRKSNIYSHKSIDGKAFYTVRPIVVKIGDWIDDKINFSFTIKNKYWHAIRSKDLDLWCLLINKDAKHFTLEGSDIECEYHETSLQFINNPKLQASIEALYLKSSNISEMSGDSF